MQTESPDSLLDLLLASGPLVWPILLASIVMMLCVLERAIALRRRRVAPKRFVQCLLAQVEENGDRDAALDLCEEEPSHVARVFAAGLRRWGKPAVEVEQAVLDEGERCAASLRRYLRIVSGVANICPLLGLLGTVWGMRVAFDQIAGSSAMGRPELLAGGISQALLSTAAGLAVAIPAMIFYLHFTGRADSLVMEIDRHGQSLVNLISAEALEDRRSTRRKRAA
ncbi:MotA/TolQ/ExbB proton channel family protein [Botrimarina hoheduenensis]|uniref:Biopolymer transport protein ExbB n=1 Tax=Botrimarina hoheduenensis TaxID=2528000 RepID=A0A5C5W9K7_9BACT|nr:MotA/TolQ/ExbB proton channel family protein [Botrimarina hoheduenensis]TWT47177.1 Biopolymer transport protein ExbB [Botrimarina hoheduenensis]